MKNTSLNFKVLSIVGIFIVACTVISLVGITRMGAIAQQIDDIVDRNVRRLTLANDVAGTLRVAVIAEKNMILADKADEMHPLVKDIDDRMAAIAKHVEEYSKLASEEGKNKINGAHSAVKNWHEISRDIQKLALAEKNAEAVLLSRGKGKEARLAVEAAIADVVELNTKQLDEATDKAREGYEHARTIMIMTSIVSILLGIGIAAFVLVRLSRTIDTVIADLTDNSAQVTSASRQIAASSQELSQASTEQASSLQETSASVEQMSSMIKKNADGAKRSADLSGGSRVSADKGKRTVQEMVNAMGEIDAANNDIMRQINDSNQKISEIVKVISEIGNKTKVINEIVFQTKLLSFNASVEAARAGEHGKGFAVVAEEVGNLAQMSGDAAKEIAAMLDGSIQKVEGIVNETKTRVEALIANGRSKVEVGARVARECGEVLDEIVNSVTSVGGTVDGIARASEEQAKGIEEINRAMAQLDQVTQQNASVSEEAASAAEQLAAQAVALRKVVQTLSTTIKGGAMPLDQGTTIQPSAMASVRAQQMGTQQPPRPVVQLREVKAQRAKKASAGTTSSELRAAAGSDVVPADDDPRFKEV